jgi:hypothetical protein
VRESLRPTSTLWMALTDPLSPNPEGNRGRALTQRDVCRGRAPPRKANPNCIRGPGVIPVGRAVQALLPPAVCGLFKRRTAHPDRLCAGDRPS